MPTETLYELVTEARDLRDSILDSDGLMTPDVIAAANALGDAIEDKTDGICRVLAQLDGESAMFAAERDRLDRQRSIRANAAQRLREYLQTQMQRLGESKIKTQLFSVSICRNSQPTVKLDDSVDVTSLPLDLLRTKIELARDKVIAAWKAGEPLPEEITCIVGTHLRIT